MEPCNLNLVAAFPAMLHDDALVSVSTLPYADLTSDTFSVRIGAEVVRIPYRIYHDPALIRSERLTQIQADILRCLLTRHHNGFAREENLRLILYSKHDWVPPFVVQLVGEYVVEIISLIRDNINRLDTRLYQEFLTNNPTFYQTTKDRVMSYWNCYHRGQSNADYAGFQILEVFDRML